MTIENDRLLTPDEASAYLGVAKTTLKDWRHDRRGPKYVRLSYKMIRYPQSALVAFGRRGL